MLHLLECALALEKYRTYHRTARHLRVSQPTVTRAIQELERLFSVTLFDRTNRGSSRPPSVLFCLRGRGASLWTSMI